MVLSAITEGLRRQRAVHRRQLHPSAGRTRHLHHGGRTGPAGGHSPGIILGALRILRNPVLRAVLRLYLEFFRIVPTLVLLFLTYYILPRELGVQVDGVTVAVVTFSLWVAAEISDIVRGSLISVSDHQVDAGKALGMNGLQVLWYVRIPSPST